MSERPSPSSLDALPTVAIEVLAVEEEEDNLDTLAWIQRVRRGLQQDLAQLDGCTVSTVSVAPTSERDIDVVVLLTLIGTSLVASKELLTSFFSMVTAALEVLAKKEHVQEIEIIAGGKTLILRDLTKKTARELIEAFAAEQSEAATITASEPPLKIKARVSHKRSKKH